MVASLYMIFFFSVVVSSSLSCLDSKKNFNFPIHSCPIWKLLVTRSDVLNLRRLELKRLLKLCKINIIRNFFI